MMRICRYGSRIGFLGVLVSSESVKDRIVVGPADHVCICTNCIPGVGGSRNR